MNVDELKTVLVATESIKHLVKEIVKDYNLVLYGHDTIDVLSFCWFQHMIDFELFTIEIIQSMTGESKNIYIKPEVLLTVINDNYNYHLVTKHFDDNNFEYLSLEVKNR